MSDPDLPRTRVPNDEQYADAYATGYGEGLREALRELLALTHRGHTPQELRFLIEGRLARIRDDVEVKRRSLLGPPRRTAWTGPSRPAPVEVAGAPHSSAPTLTSLLIEPGQSYLFLETRPGAALDFVADHAPRFPRLVALSRRRPSHPKLANDRWTFLALGGGGPSPGETSTYDPGGASGRVREATEAVGGALVYLDAVETLVTDFGLDVTLRFVSFLINQAQRTQSVLVVSEDRGALPPAEQSRFQRLFNIVT